MGGEAGNWAGAVAATLATEAGVASPSAAQKKGEDSISGCSSGWPRVSMGASNGNKAAPPSAAWRSTDTVSPRPSTLNSCGAKFMGTRMQPCDAG